MRMAFTVVTLLQADKGGVDCGPAAPLSHLEVKHPPHRIPAETKVEKWEN